MKASITPAQRRRWIRKGKGLLQSKLISGFNIEDHGSARGARLHYAHDSERHSMKVRRGTGGGRLMGRESYYRWNKEWKKGRNTRLIHNSTVAQEFGTTYSTPSVSKADRFIRKRAVRKLSRKPISESWVVPDVRITGEAKRERYRRAWLVTRRIDPDTRFSTIVTRRKKLAKVRGRLKGEVARRVLIQDYMRKNSLWWFIDENS